MLPRIEAANEGIEDSRRAIHDIERRVKTLLDNFPRGDRHRIFIGHPSRVHAIHVYTFEIILRRRPGHHVERGLGNVGVRMAEQRMREINAAYAVLTRPQ